MFGLILFRLSLYSFDVFMILRLLLISEDRSTQDRLVDIW
jgi:hypothetical protein